LLSTAIFVLALSRRAMAFQRVEDEEMAMLSEEINVPENISKFRRFGVASIITAVLLLAVKAYSGNAQPPQTAPAVDVKAQVAKSTADFPHIGPALAAPAAFFPPGTDPSGIKLPSIGSPPKVPPGAGPYGMTPPSTGPAVQQKWSFGDISSITELKAVAPPPGLGSLPAIGLPGAGPSGMTPPSAGPASPGMAPPKGIQLPFGPPHPPAVQQKWSLGDLSSITELKAMAPPPAIGSPPAMGPPGAGPYGMAPPSAGPASPGMAPPKGVQLPFGPPRVPPAVQQKWSLGDLSSITELKAVASPTGMGLPPAMGPPGTGPYGMTPPSTGPASPGMAPPKGLRLPSAFIGSPSKGVLPAVQQKWSFGDVSSITELKAEAPPPMLGSLPAIGLPGAGPSRMTPPSAGPASPGMAPPKGMQLPSGPPHPSSVQQKWSLGDLSSITELKAMAPPTGMGLPPAMGPPGAGPASPGMAPPKGLQPPRGASGPPPTPATATK
jgi:hypothetical protein